MARLDACANAAGATEPPVIAARAIRVARAVFARTSDVVMATMDSWNASDFSWPMRRSSRWSRTVGEGPAATIRAVRWAMTTGAVIIIWLARIQADHGLGVLIGARRRATRTESWAQCGGWGRRLLPLVIPFW